MTEPLSVRELGSTGVRVTNLCVGTSSLGGMAHIYGYDVDAARGEETIEATFDSPIKFIDTSNDYGNGESERRIGAAILRRGGLPDNFVLATKADPLPGSLDFSADRIRASFEESAARLGRDHFDVYYLHDPERLPFEVITAPGGALDGMLALKAEGKVGVIGVAGGDVDDMRRYVDTGHFDVLLNHNRYTLLDRSADALITHAVDAGMAFVNAAPYASGMLAKPSSENPRYQYGAPSDRITKMTGKLRRICQQYDVSLPAVALQFSTRDPRITSTVVGLTRPARVRELVENEASAIPAELWRDIEILLEA